MWPPQIPGKRNVPKEPCQRPLDAISRVAARLLRDAVKVRSARLDRQGELSTNSRDFRRLIHLLSTGTDAGQRWGEGGVHLLSPEA